MDEFSFIDSIKQKTYKQPSLIKGIGDDAAVFRETSRSIVTAVDTFVEGVHFSRQTMEPFHVGYRILAANLSDMAAMAAKPAYYLVSIVVPEDWSMEELSEIFNGMKSLAGHYQVDLIGGDTVSGDKLMISITVIGFVDQGKIRYRHEAKPGDIVFVTGTLGDSQAGLYILMNTGGKYQDKSYFVNKHRMPTPRVDFATSLQQIPRMSLNDVSDGIANEAAEIAAASRVSIRLEDDAIPTSSAFCQFPQKLQKDWKYYGGEDFELIGTIPVNDWGYVKKTAQQHGIRVTKIGEVTNRLKPGSVYFHVNNKIEILPKKGFTHLK